MNELQLIMNDIAEWSAKTFENATSINKLNHLTKEVDKPIIFIASYRLGIYY